MDPLSRSTESLIDELVQIYDENNERISLFRDQLQRALADSTRLSPLIHSTTTRLKDPEHLRDKLRRQAQKAKEKGRPFDITPENLLTRINDLAGVRLLHLYTRQIREIDQALREILHEQRYALLEGPVARTWDDESRAFFRTCSIETVTSSSLYTSVHYVVGSASRTTVTCEIQVRTLMEEVWGEVDHSINYPKPAESLACREQLKVLARVTSSATRLVDSIFTTFEADRTKGEEPSPARGPRPSNRPTAKRKRKRTRA